MKTFAISLYANEAESEDELTFNKNDLLQILQYDYLGMEGWWLCKLVRVNQVGLAAGNRLKVVHDEKLLQKFQSVLAQNSGTTSNSNASSKTNLNSSMSSIFSTTSSSTVSSSGSSSVSSPIDSSTSNTNKNVIFFNKMTFI